MATINHITEGGAQSLGGYGLHKLGESSDDALESLTDVLSDSTIGVLLLDANLRCLAFGSTLADKAGISLTKDVGKQLDELFPCGGHKLEVDLRRVWTTGKSVTNLHLTTALSSGGGLRRWLVNFHPISDESGTLRLVAATFSEITRERFVQVRIKRLRDKFDSYARNRLNHPVEEFSEMSTRMFEVVNRSLALLKTSTLLRSYASQTRLGARLVRHALFLKTNEEPELLSYFEQPVIPVEPQPSDEPGPANAGDQAEGNPSPREREVLHLLADGKSNKEIALILAISTRTVEAYRARVMTKLDLHTTAALVRYAVRHKIIEA